MSASVLLCACDPISGPVNLFHDLEGGEIAANRPPPPGVGAPYPALGTVPGRPVMPDAPYRQALQAQLSAERDRTQRLAADTPIEAVPPGPTPTAPVAADTPNAVLDTAETPAPAPTPPPPAPPKVAPPPASAAAPIPSVPPDPFFSPPLAPTPAPNIAGLPTVPDSPPPPASFEDVAAQPAPTPHVLSARLPIPAAGTPVFFATASAALAPSQMQALKEFAAARRGRSVEILGLGDASSDTPDGQATAIALGLARARAVADALQGLHVPQGNLRIGANAFGRGAVVRLVE